MKYHLQISHTVVNLRLILKYFNMKLKFSLLSIVFLCAAFVANAQTSKISGSVNNAGKALAKATVSLLKAKDSSMAKAEVSDASGKYEFEGVKPGSYIIAVSSVGFNRSYSNAVTVSGGDNITVPAIALQQASGTMSGVTVAATGRKPLIEVKADKTIFNVESSINATGSNAFELLQKSPGVVTDKDDNISMRGKNGVRVYIDGRPSQLAAADLAAYLKSINSTDIEAIETITNPSAKYDAEGNAGIINIRLKKNKKFGTNGSLTGGLAVGEKPKTNMGISLNNRNKKANWFSNYSNSWVDNIMRFDLNREQSGISNINANVMNMKGWSHNAKVGADFFMDAKNTIGFIATYNVNNQQPITTTKSTISNLVTGIRDSIIYSSNKLAQNNKNFNFNLNYRFADAAGHEFELNGDKGFYKGRKNSYQPNATYLPYPETLLRNDDYRFITPTDIDITTVKVDYASPTKKGKIEAGAKVAFVTTENTSDNYNIYTGNYELKDLTRSNSFTYKENINALYASYLHMFNQKWNLQTGVRMESTNSEGDLVRADGSSSANDNVKRNYTDFFPSAAVTYNQSMNHIFNLAYSRRIDRPNYQDLNPFEFKLNNLTYQKGNPFLQPQYTDAITLTHTYKYRYSTALSYSHIADFRSQWIDTLERTKSYITQRNLASQDIINLNFSLPFQITKSWMLYANINAYSSKYKANLGDDQKVNVTVNSGNLYIQNAFTLKDGFSAEISGFVTAPGVWGGTIKSKAMGTLDIGMQKTIFNNKGTVKISYTDLLKTMYWRGSSDYNGSKFNGKGTFEAQQIKLNFTYRFGNNQVKAARQRKSGSEEENKRLQQSGGGMGGGN